ncbi:hypothetical protein LXL04_021733 [Taraxacum kok-saghyz]
MDTSKEVSTMENVFCSLTDDDLNEIRDNFKIDSSFQLVLPTSNQTVKNPPEGFVGIYHQFLKPGLRFPVFDFLKTVLSHYNLHIVQLAPNSFRKIICFVMLSHALWRSSKPHCIDDICDGIPSSIKRWKPEFIFVDVGEFSPDMDFGDHKNRAVDYPPDLTSAQQVLIDQMMANPVKWSDPDELMLGMAGLSSYWTNLGKQPIFMVGDFLGPSVLDTALEEESSMDSANQTEGDRECTSDVAKTGRRAPKSAGPASGGSSSPDSEKGKSGSGEIKDISQSKRRRLVRGGRHSGKGASVEDQKLVPPTVVVSVSNPDVPPTSLYECPVSADAALEGVTVAPDTSPVGSIFFPPSQLPTTASLTRSVDLPLPKTTESSSISGTTVVPPPVFVSSPDPILSSEKQADIHLSPPGVENLSSSQPEAILSVPAVPSSPEVAEDTISPDSPFSVKVSLPGCSSSIPTLVSLAATLPAFQRPYIASSVGRVPGLGELSEEEGLDRARSLFLEGIHWANGVMLRQRTRASVLAAQQTECERLKKSMENAHADYMTMVEGKLKLVRELQQMELRNQELVMEIDSVKEKQKESMDVRQSIEKQLEDAHRHREFDLKKLEEVGQQLEKEQKAQLLRLEDQVRVLTAECSAAKQAGLFHQQMSEQHAGDLSWLLKHGVAFSVRASLNSEEFGNLNAACQTASIQVGLTQACLEMKAKYPLLENEPPLHSYPHSQEEMLDRFSQMTSHEYQLLRMLREGSVGVEYLKKYLDEGDDEEVNVVGGGSIGIADFESVRADSADSARPNVDDCGDSKMFEDRAVGDDYTGLVLSQFQIATALLPSFLPGDADCPTPLQSSPPTGQLGDAESSTDHCSSDSDRLLLEALLLGADLLPPYRLPPLPSLDGTVLGEADSTCLTGNSEGAGGEDESMLGVDGKETKVSDEKEAKKMDAEKDKLDDIANEDASKLEGVDGGSGGTGNTDEVGAKFDGADKLAE